MLGDSAEYYRGFPCTFALHCVGARGQLPRIERSRRNDGSNLTVKNFVLEMKKVGLERCTLKLVRCTSVSPSILLEYFRLIVVESVSRH